MGFNQTLGLQFFTPSDVHKMLPNGAGLSLKRVEELIRHFGTHRDFGSDALLLTSEDVEDFIRELSTSKRKARRRRDLPSNPHEQGTVVFLSRSTDDDIKPGDTISRDQDPGGAEPVFVGWAREGEVHELVESVQRGSPYPIGILAYGRATPREVEQLRTKFEQYRTYEQSRAWFYRTRFVNSIIDGMRRFDLESDETAKLAGNSEQAGE